MIAASMALYLIKGLPSPNVGNVYPFEKLFHHKANYSMLHVFARVCFVHLSLYGFFDDV